jgi:hypothetical protein
LPSNPSIDNEQELTHHGCRRMKTTRYFDEQVVRKRPYLRVEWCQAAVLSPAKREIQADGRIRHWTRVIDTPDGKARMLRVITLDDGETIHNAFFDRDYDEDAP